MKMYSVIFEDVSQNHDNQVNITHLEEIQRELQVSPLSYTRAAPPGIGGEAGPGNYWVPVGYFISIFVYVCDPFQVYAKDSGEDVLPFLTGS